MKSKFIKILLAVLLLSVVTALGGFGCDCNDKEDKPVSLTIDEYTVCDISNFDNYDLPSRVGYVTDELLTDYTVGGKTGNYLKLNFKSGASGTGALDFVFNPVYEKSHYEQLLAQKDNYYVSMNFYIDIKTQDIPNDENGVVVGPYLWSSIFNLGGEWGRPQRTTGWYEGRITLQEFVDEYDMVNKLFRGKRTSGKDDSVLHTWSNVNIEFDLYLEEIRVVEGEVIDERVLPIEQTYNIDEKDIKQEITDVMEVNGKTGNFVKNEITFLTKGNAKFALKGVDDYENYQSALSENPDIAVNFYAYFDMNNAIVVSSTNGDSWISKMNFASPAFGVDEMRVGSVNTTVVGEEEINDWYYLFQVSVPLNDFIENNYINGVFSGKELATFWFADTLYINSGITLYYSFELGEYVQPEEPNEPETPINYTLNVSRIYETTADKITQNISTATEVNGKTGEFIKNEIIFNEKGNAIFTLSGSVIDDYQKYLEILSNNENAQVKFYIYLDLNNSKWHTDNYQAKINFASEVFDYSVTGVREYNSTSKNYYYQYETTTLLSTFIESAYTDGVYSGDSLFNFDFVNNLNANSGITVYFSWVVK